MKAENREKKSFINTESEDLFMYYLEGMKKVA